MPKPQCASGWVSPQPLVVLAGTIYAWVRFPPTAKEWLSSRNLTDICGWRSMRRLLFPVAFLFTIVVGLVGLFLLPWVPNDTVTETIGVFSGVLLGTGLGVGLNELKTTLERLWVLGLVLVVGVLLTVIAVALQAQSPIAQWLDAQIERQIGYYFAAGGVLLGVGLSAILAQLKTLSSKAMSGERNDQR